MHACAVCGRWAAQRPVPRQQTEQLLEKAEARRARVKERCESVVMHTRQLEGKLLGQREPLGVLQSLPVVLYRVLSIVLLGVLA